MLHEELQTSLEFLGPVEVIKFNCKVAIIHFLGVPSLSTSQLHIFYCSSKIIQDQVFSCIIDKRTAFIYIVLNSTCKGFINIIYTYIYYNIYIYIYIYIRLYIYIFLYIYIRSIYWEQSQLKYSVQKLLLFEELDSLLQYIIQIDNLLYLRICELCLQLENFTSYQ